MKLPIHNFRDEILRSLSTVNRLVLSAPTGSGKTTQVPQFILESDFGTKQILVLEPRRLATRLVAERVARELGESAGGRVGYQTRHDSRISDRTVIRFITEGLFVRLLQSNPKLDGVGTVILDEFHERNLASDVAIALLKRLQESIRPDLRLLVMSATLDTKLISEYLNCPILEAPGRAYPVEIRYLDKRPVRRAVVGKLHTGRNDVPPWDLAADALAEIVESNEPGDVLIFMPGAYEIRRTIELCQQIGRDENLSVFPLYSELPVREQDAALSPCENRKVIVSTNVAETSITIEGVRHVIDSGLARMNRFDPRRGINVLLIEPISQSSADQRAGRAGRTAPGTCLRLWVESEHHHRPKHETPEIRRLELSQSILQIKAMGAEDVANFPWLQPPEPAALQQAEKLLQALGATATDGKLTEMGRRMSRLPMHPRLARMLIEADQRRCLERACLWAAIISERDILIRGAKHELADDLPDGPRSDLVVLERALHLATDLNFDIARCNARGIHALACRELEKTRRLFLDTAADERLRPGGKREATIEAMAKCLLVAFPDHLAIRRNENNLACAVAGGVGGRKGQLDPETIALHAGPLLPVEIREIGAGQAVKTVLSVVTEIELQWMHEVFGPRIASQRLTSFNPQTSAVETVEIEVFDSLTINESPAHDADPSAAGPILAEQVLIGALKLEKWDEETDQWIERSRCVGQWFPERRLITYNDDERRLIIEETCAGAIRYKDIRERPCLAFVKNAMSWEDQQFVEKMAPQRYDLPSGWRMKLQYSAGNAPRGRARIQDLYGLNQTPTIAAGRAKILLEILAPSQRPVQLTDDLPNFWKNLYPTLKKELARKYPRHEWR